MEFAESLDGEARVTGCPGVFVCLHMCMSKSRHKYIPCDGSSLCVVYLGTSMSSSVGTPKWVSVYMSEYILVPEW